MTSPLATGSEGQTSYTRNDNSGRRWEMSTQSDPNTGRDTAERDTLSFDPGPLGEPASVSKLPHFQRNQD